MISEIIFINLGNYCKRHIRVHKSHECLCGLSRFFNRWWISLWSYVGNINNPAVRFGVTYMGVARLADNNCTENYNSFQVNSKTSLLEYQSGLIIVVLLIRDTEQIGGELWQMNVNFCYV